jgi:hypothetical protein
MKIHPIFHVSILEPFDESTIPRKHIQPTSLIKIDDEKEFEVEFLLKFVSFSQMFGIPSPLAWI